MKTVAIIQARMDSTRLPGKVLADLAGRPVLAWVVDAATAIPGVDVVVVATSHEPSDDPIAAWCEAYGVGCQRGSKLDVLDRMIKAAEAEGADVIVRLTADCPLLDPAVCGQVVLLRRRMGADYASNTKPCNWPDGLDCEVITSAANQLPQIDSTPIFGTTLGETYQYDVQASDPDGDVLVYDLERAPLGMSIDTIAGTVR